MSVEVSTSTEAYARVPKEREANLAYRRNLLERAAKDTVLQQNLRDICQRDLLFFVNFACWLVEPREASELPFITWDFQDAEFQALNADLGKRDVIVEKSRDMGYSWIIVTLFVWRWLFYPHQYFAVASRSEEYVDQLSNPDSLFSKIDFILERLPKWMLPRGFKWDIHRVKKHLINPANRSDIKGYATTDDIARGGRRLAILLDEFAAFSMTMGRKAWRATSAATRCRLAVSTHTGTVGAFMDIVRKARLDRKTFCYRHVHWSKHPLKVEALKCQRCPADKPLQVSNGKCSCGGKLWSTWYQEEVNRALSDREVAGELDIDPEGAGSGFFGQAVIEHAQQYIKEPLLRGRLIYDAETLEPVEFQEDSGGNLEIWQPLVNRKPPKTRYANGCDISAGTGSTPSCMEFINMETGEKVAEYTDSRKYPAVFAREAVAISKWFHEAKIIWEAQGPGATFSQEIRNSGYRNLYRRKTNEGDLAPEPTQHIGWGANPTDKRKLLENFREAMAGEYLERSQRVLDECPDYRYSEDGTSVEQAKARDSEDPTAARQNHGDHVMATALAWKLVKEGRMLKQQAPPTKKIAQPGSFAHFYEQEVQQEAESAEWGGLKL